MPGSQPLDILPLWAFYLVIVLAGLLAVEIGFWLGWWWQQRSPQEKEGTTGATVGAILAMLAFLLVFLTGIAVNRFDNRRQLVIKEANAIGTTFLRAGYLEEPYRTDIRQFLQEYVATRLAPTRDSSKLAAAIVRSEEIQTELWSRAEALAIAYPSAEVVAIFIESLNEVIDLHTERVVAVFNRIPFNFWLVIFFMAFLALMMVGFQNGQAGSRNLIAIIALILVFAAVIQLNIDLDRPQEGFLQVSQQAMINVQQMMKAAQP
jgi:hypothetical protein